MRYFSLALLSLVAGSAGAATQRWFPVNMELGCVPFSDLYHVHPELDGRKSPSELVDTLKKNYTNAKAQPFVEVYDSKSYREGHPNGAADATAAEQATRKLFTRSNAVMLTWSKDGNDDGLLLYIADLCKSLYGKSPS